MKERIEDPARVYGNVDLFAYNRDMMGSDEIPPLNTTAGQAWQWPEIEAVRPDLIIFDDMMCLLIGPFASMDEERRNLILHKRVRRSADEHGCTIAEVNGALDRHPIETNR